MNISFQAMSTKNVYLLSSTYRYISQGFKVHDLIEYP